MDLDPEGRRLPIKIDTASNGEYLPRPLQPLEQAANAEAQRFVGEAARKAGLQRRAFLKTCAGSAATLLAFNAVYARAGVSGGGFDIPVEAAFDTELAQAALGGDDFIFDIQTHCVDPAGGWQQGKDGERWARVLNRIFPQRRKCSDEGFSCYSAEQLVKDVFLDSDTDMMVLSFVPSKSDAEPLTIESADAVRRIVDQMEGSHRLLLHGRVNPNQAGDVERMDELAQRWGYPPGKPTLRGVRTGAASSCQTTPVCASSRKHVISASRTFAYTRASPSAAARTSTVSAVTSGNSLATLPMSISLFTTPDSFPAIPSRPTSKAATATVSIP